MNAPQTNQSRRLRITPFGWAMLALSLLLALGLALMVTGLLQPDFLASSGTIL